MNRRQFRPAAIDRLEDRLVMSSAGHGLHAAAVPVGARQAPGVDVAQIESEVNLAFSTFESNFQSAFFTLNGNSFIPGFTTDAAARRANLEVLRVASAHEISLLGDQLGLIVAPLRGSARLESLIRDRVASHSPGSLARVIDANFDLIPQGTPSAATPFGSSQLISSADMTLTEAARLATDDIVSTFISGGANARRGPGHATGAALNRTRDAVNQAFTSFANDVRFAAQAGLTSLTFDPTPYDPNGPFFSNAPVVIEPIRQATIARVGRLVTEIDAALASLPGASGRLQPYVRNMLGGLDTGSLLLTTNALLSNLEISTNPTVSPDTTLPPPLGYSPTQYFLDVSGALIEIDRAATSAILAAYNASPGLRR